MLYYTQMTLDRASNERKDQNWLLSQMGDNSRWLLIQDDANLVRARDNELHYLSRTEVADLALQDAIFLGRDEAHSYFALDVSKQRDKLSFIDSESEFIDMRQVGRNLPKQQGSIGVLARGLCYWHKTHCFCGRCGQPNKMVEAGHARRCVNPECRHMTFPRTDPAVIMLITHVFPDGVERCLLGRQAVWPEGVFSTLAGFVDPGESLEQAVIREVMEEAGVEAYDATYIASQPWPFPSSLMLGFIAKAKTTEIFVEQDELEQAKWFSRAELNTFSEWGDTKPGYKLTREDSISRYLVEYWRAQSEE
ncbi:NAD+ diphosphatase [Pseudoalteromonas piscicida]|uniref:NAD(+) diphosphatase n=2 Tax=Pseudoalteromonas piscicida TaxID=43662 RepID=A0ABM6NBB3_PSEO7|nr:NAD+ diphosphatase [Pseudoalteromonas piscicida]